MKLGSDVIQRIKALPWWAQSPLQGLVGGILVAQGGLAVLPLSFLILPFLDIAAISRTRYLLKAFKEKEDALNLYATVRGADPTYDRSILWISWARPIASACLNGFVALTTAPLVAPYSYGAAETQRDFFRLVAQPVTYSNVSYMTKTIEPLLKSEDKAPERYWLKRTQVTALESKLITVNNTTKQYEEEQSIIKAINFAIASKASPSNYQRILVAANNLPLNPRFAIIISKEKATQLKKVQEEAEAVSADVVEKRKVEQARIAKVQAQQQVEQDFDNLCGGLYKEMIINMPTGDGEKFLNKYQEAGCPSDFSRYVGRYF